MDDDRQTTLRERDLDRLLGFSIKTTGQALDIAERALAALKGCVEAHETGRDEPAQIAYEAAKNLLAEMGRA